MERLQTEYLFDHARPALRPFLYLAFHFINEAYDHVFNRCFIVCIENRRWGEGLFERNNGPSIVSLSLIIKNLTRSPNCVLMILKLAISFSIKLVNPVFCFSCELQKSPFVRVAWTGRPFSTSKAIHWNRFWPNNNQCITLARPLQAQWASFALDFPLAKSVHKIIAAHQMETLMRPCLIQAAPFFNRK